MKVSLILSTYNWPQALTLSLLSACQQTYDDYEIIVADDGSGPDTAQAIARVQTQTQAQTGKTILHAWHADSGFRLGSTMELSGYDTRLNRRRLDALERGAAEYLHIPTGPTRQEEWYGWRPLTFDDLPLIGRAPGRERTWLATGHGMMGVSMSVATARLLDELMTGKRPHIDPAPYAPDRFV